MKRLSARAVSALTNAALALVFCAVAAVCLFPAASAASELEEGIFRRGNSENGVSLMINVYEGSEIVLKMLDVLDEYGAKATFFIGGCWADDNVDCVREIARRGQEIGSHGYFHLSHGSLDYDANVREIGTSMRLISLITGNPVSLFAPPSGDYGEETVRAADALGVKTVLWSRDTVDWRDADKNLCIRRATEGVKGGEFVLMHPKQHTLEALPAILEYLNKNGLVALSVGENLGLKST